MSVVLACDLGSRRTGVALGDVRDGTVVALPTVESTSDTELTTTLQKLAAERHVDTVLLGLPLLPGGQEGSQAGYSRKIGNLLEKAGLAVEFLDERYTTDRAESTNGDTKAACQLLITFLERRDLTK